MGDWHVSRRRRGLPTGNLLGRALSRVRSEFFQEAAAFAAQSIAHAQLNSNTKAPAQAGTNTAPSSTLQSAEKGRENNSKPTKAGDPGTNKANTKSSPGTPPPNALPQRTARENKLPQNTERNITTSPSSTAPSTGPTAGKETSTQRKAKTSDPSRSNKRPLTEHLNSRQTNKGTDERKTPGDRQQSKIPTHQRDKKVDQRKTMGEKQQGKPHTGSHGSKDTRK